MLEERKVKWWHWMLDRSLTTWHQRSHFICVEPHLTKFMARGFSLDKKNKYSLTFSGLRVSNWIPAFSNVLVTGHNIKTQGYHRVHGQFEFLNRCSDLVSLLGKEIQRNATLYIDHVPLAQFVNPWANLQNGNQED